MKIKYPHIDFFPVNPAKTFRVANFVEKSGVNLWLRGSRKRCSCGDLSAEEKWPHMRGEEVDESFKIEKNQ